MDFLQKLRLKQMAEANDPFGSNIKKFTQPFGGQTATTFPPPSSKPGTIRPDLVGSSPLTPPNNYIGQLNELYNRPTPRIKEFESYLGTEPKREDYQLGKIGKILAAVAGGAEGWNKGPTAGINTFSGLTETPYARAQEAWKSKGARLKDLADLERQGLTDAEKRIVQAEKFRIDQDENERQWLELESGLDLKANQIRNIQSLIRNRGLETQLDTKTGKMWVINKETGERVTDLGQFAESALEEEAREMGTWKEREAISQRNRIELQDRLFGQQRGMEGIRTANDKDLARLRATLGREDEALKAELEGMSTAAQRAAWTTAFEQASLDNPDLAADPNKRPDFMVEVRRRLKTIRSRARSNVPTDVEGTGIDIGDDPAGLFSVP